MRRGAADARLAALARLELNYDPARIDLAHPPSGWTVEDRREMLPGEAPGAPTDGGSFEIAARLIRGYAFADPSLVRAHYDPDAPLEGRDMLLELRALGLVSIHVGVRVSVVWDEECRSEGRRVRRFGWAYRTLQGHVEQGQMGWQVWKWLDTGEVEFRSHAVSRTARIANPLIWLGFRALKGHERRRYLESTNRRVRELTERALRGESPAQALRSGGRILPARRGGEDDASPSGEIASASA